MRPIALIPAVALAVALVATIGASARPQATAIQVGTVMNAAQEVPAPSGDVSNARGDPMRSFRSVRREHHEVGLGRVALVATCVQRPHGQRRRCAHPYGCIGLARPGRAGPVRAMSEPAHRYRQPHGSGARSDRRRHRVRQRPHSAERPGGDPRAARDDREHRDDTHVAARGA